MENKVNRRSFLKHATALTTISFLSPHLIGCSAATDEIYSGEDIHFKSAGEVARLIRDKKISSLELTKMMLSRIEKIDVKINAINVLLEEEALDKARKADEALAKGKIVGPLHGVPITIKDSFRIKGVVTTAGNPALADYVPDYDATSVARLKDAGAIILGNTNTPYMLDDHQSFNDIYGRTNNPWDLGRSPGGSTGGGAAALAAGLSYLSLGSDTGGSIRVPSHFCGIFGHKPTIELVPKKGQIPPLPGSLPYKSNGLSVAGPLARSTGDLKLLLEVCGGPVKPESTAYSWRLPKARKSNLKDYKIKYILDDELCPVSSEIKPTMEIAINEFRKSGLKLEEGWPSNVSPKEQFHLYMYLQYAFLSRGASDEVIEELKSTAKSDESPLRALRRRAFTEPHKYFNEQDSKRLKVREIWQEYFQDYDAFILPTAFAPAYPHTTVPWNERMLKTPEGERHYDDMLFWISFATLTGLPATVFPIGVTKIGLPVGLQIIGPFMEDETPIHLAEKLSEIVGGIKHPSGYM